jgi:hypothetical protein
MKMQRFILLLALMLSALAVFADTEQEPVKRVKYKHAPGYIFRLTLTDKQGTGYSLEHPTRFLSKRSVERRKRQGLPLDSTDLPVSHRHKRAIENHEVAIIGESRWMNSVLVKVKDTVEIQRLKALSCVKACKLVWQSPDSITPTAIKTKYHDHFEAHDSIGGQIFGKATQQIQVLKGQRLHDIGCCGDGMMIAVIDGGFKNADKIPAFQQIDILGWRDFVCPPSPSIFAETDHGTKVLSAMAINTPLYYIGTAPKACYWLLRSEDQQTEQEVEEDYWVMAAEFADSVGCNLINSSLGYNEYDHPQMSHQLWQLDGHTAFISQAASLLADKGILLVNSAGNSGMGPWKKIGFPADAKNILTVGSVVPESPWRIAPFSSVGPTQDGRVKPDIVAVGAPAYLVNGRGVITEDMGTSFSTPIVCGLAACLWQALPHLNVRQLIQLICETGNNHHHPDNIYGHGVPNFWRAYMIGKYGETEKLKE